MHEGLFPGGGGTIRSRRPQADGVESSVAAAQRLGENLTISLHHREEPLARFFPVGAPAARKQPRGGEMAP
jgi:hypothetical protein